MDPMGKDVVEQARQSAGSAMPNPMEGVDWTAH